MADNSNGPVDNKSSLKSTGNAVLDFLQQFPSADVNGSSPGTAPLNGTDGQEAAAPLQDQNQEQDFGMSDDELAVLLRQLDEADGVATGLEQKLDGILDNLEDLLSGLEDRRRSSSDAGAEKEQ
ncbi:hypothetical protein FRB99_000742 [Tulasnella sp. 403]|nr:hypothetical protein FRB99_000742 [Tulasnella sp. 403]